MNDRKTWAAILGIVVLLSGFLIFVFFKDKETERSLRIQKEQALAAKTQELAQIQAQLADAQKEKADLEAKLEDTLALQEFTMEEFQQTTEKLNSQLTALAQDKTSLASAMDENTQLMHKLNQKIETLDRQKRELTVEIEKLKTEKADLQTRLEKPPVTEPEEEPATTRAPMPEVVDLGQILLKKSSHEAAKIEHVNILWGFVVIGAGSDDGLKPDTVVNISRNNRFIAKAVVKKVRPGVSTALTAPEWTREEIKPGDFVSLAHGR